MILACNNISKAFVENVVLSKVSFHIEEKEKAAIVGINGAGKSTLLKIIVGEMTPDEGMVTIAKGKTLGYLAQHQSLTSHNSIYNELLEVKQDIIDLEEKIRDAEVQMKSLSGSALDELMENYTRMTHEFELNNGYAYKSEIVGVLKGLGFTEDEFSKEISALSGGQKTRVALGKLLLSKPDIILLDEPTNHLDMSSIAWLETFLLNYDGSVIIVAHDRYFLDRVVTKVVELDNSTATTFSGNYTAYAEKKAMLRDALMHQYLNQQREIKHQEAVIEKLRSFNREKSIKRAESREKLLNKMDVIDKPITQTRQMNIQLEPHIVSGNDVLSVTGLSKSYDSQTLFEDISFDIKRGERIAIIGNNGTGKTTILKLINQLIEPDSGEIRLGSKVCIGYYDQEHQVLHMDKTLFDEISDTYPNLNNTEIRNVLAAFLFTNDDVFKRIGDLSGGERGRVSLAKLMLSESNFLILDEPTNHLDIESKEILEDALNNYTGTVLYVSHDRYFINKTATRILELTNQALVNYIGNYDYYLEKKEELTNIYAPAQAVVQKTASPISASTSPSAAAASNAASASGSKADWLAQKEEQARLRKRQNELAKVEEEIHKLETRNEEIDELLVKEEVYTDLPQLMKLNNEKNEINEKLESLYEKWEELAE